MVTSKTMTADLDGPPEVAPRRPHRYPAWAAPFLANPLRRLFENPEALVRPWLEPGMTILDVGCATGYFSLPLARLTGGRGQVLCVDVEPRMVKGLVRRARRAGLLDRIEPILCGEHNLGLSGRGATVDLAVVIHALHEMSDVEGGLRQVAEALKPGGRMLLIEPRGHVSSATWDHELDVARGLGLLVTQQLDLRRRYGAVLEKPRAVSGPARTLRRVATSRAEGREGRPRSR